MTINRILAALEAQINDTQRPPDWRHAMSHIITMIRTEIARGPSDADIVDIECAILGAPHNALEEAKAAWHAIMGLPDGR